MMECFYFETLTTRDNEILISGEEYKHLKALRIQKGERICIVNGKGLSAFGFVKGISKNYYDVQILNFVENLGEIEKKVDIAVGILENKERYEYAFEKSVEFRISEFYPLITKHTQKLKIEEERLLRKGISAIKQTYRSRLPIINPPIYLNELMKKFKEYDKVFVFDLEGKKFEYSDFDSTLLVVGPEGGFAESEIKSVARRKNVEIVKICDYPLRSETAVVSALAILTNQLNQM